MQRFAYIILADGQVDAVEYTEHEATAHMADLHAMGCVAQQVVVGAEHEAEAYDTIDAYCREDTRATMRSHQKLKQWEARWARKETA